MNTPSKRMGRPPKAPSDKSIRRLVTFPPGLWRRFTARYSDGERSDAVQRAVERLLAEEMVTIRTCETCHLQYCPHLEEDQLEHERCHRRWMRAVKALGYNPMPGPDREALKHEGWQMISEGAPLEVQVDGALKVIRSHFDRSLSTAIDGSYWQKHPSFEEYASMTTIKHFPPDVIQAIVDRFGRQEGHIPDGYSYWVLPERRAAEQPLFKR